MKENKSLVTAIVVLAVVVVGYVLWVSYANKKVREVVDTSLARLEERMEAKGNEVTITYDDVKVHSFSLRPRASVYKLHIKIEDTRRDREVHLMLPELVYTPKTFNMRSYKLELLDSATMMASERGQEQESTLMDFSSSPTLHVSEKSNGDMHYGMEVPEHITLTEVEESTDTASATKTDINFASQPQVEWMVSGQGISLDQKAVFPQTTITHGGEVMAQADGLSIETQHSEGANNVHSYAMLARLDNLTFTAPELEVLNPVSIINDVTYTGPAVAPGDTTPVNAPQHYKLKNIAWVSGLVSLFANGEVHFEPEKEKMPYGNIALRFDNVDKFLDYVKAQRPKTEAYLLKVRAALEQLSGASLEEGGSVTINLDRQPGGRLYIGELTLEESLGLLIEMAMDLPDFSEPEDDAEAEDEVAEPAEEAPAEEADNMDGDSAEEPAADKVEAAPTSVPTPLTIAPEQDEAREIRTDKDEVSVEVVHPQAMDADAEGDDAADSEKEAEPASKPAPVFTPTEAVPAE